MTLVNKRLFTKMTSVKVSMSKCLSDKVSKCQSAKVSKCQSAKVSKIPKLIREDTFDIFDTLTL